MPNRHETLTSLFSDIANSIRAKTGDTAEIKADDFDTAISAIPTGGGGGSDDYFWIENLDTTDNTVVITKLTSTYTDDIWDITKAYDGA